MFADLDKWRANTSQELQDVTLTTEEVKALLEDPYLEEHAERIAEELSALGGGHPKIEIRRGVFGPNQESWMRAKWPDSYAVLRDRTIAVGRG